MVWAGAGPQRRAASRAVLGCGLPAFAELHRCGLAGRSCRVSIVRCAGWPENRESLLGSHPVPIELHDARHSGRWVLYGPLVPGVGETGHRHWVCRTLGE